MLTNEQRELLKRPINPTFIKKNDYDKYGDGLYVPVEIYIRGMNEIFGPTNWSYEVIREVEEEGFVNVLVGVRVNGNMIRQEYGTAKKDKKDNSQAKNAALSFGLKKCCERIGLFPNMTKNWDAPLFGEAPKPQVTKEQLKEMIDELKAAYDIKSKEQFVSFAQIWNKDITKYEDLNPEKFINLYNYVQENEKEFETWKPVA